MKLLRGVQNVLQARQEAARVERAVGAGHDPFPGPAIVPGTARGRLEQWAKSLRNRNAANDRSMVTKHLIPPFGHLPIDQITLPVVMAWIDELADSDLSPQTQRHALGTLSRFFSWAIERGEAVMNPVKMVPPSKRPVLAINRDQPWLEDEAKVPELVEALGSDVGLMFYLANRSGLRLGEVCGLRLGDLEFLGEGVIRVAHSYGGPLKEDRRGEGKVKWVPAPIDAEEVLKLHLKRRKLNGAKAEDLVFVPAKAPRRPRKSSWPGFRKEHVHEVWDSARKAVGVSMTWYQATRHTAVSRALKAGVPLDEVSAAVGHSSPDVTARHYAHFVRTQGVRGGLAPADAAEDGAKKDLATDHRLQLASSESKQAADVHARDRSSKRRRPHRWGRHAQNLSSLARVDQRLDRVDIVRRV
ncbi:MAG TPA: tyrosine-type recombinase/integrase [Polyangia bacterium]|nr:tyrosine-type recombinase/integrase [Polyangia bacterium]